MSSTTASPLPECIELTGEGLVLRDWTEGDLAAMPDLFDHPDTAYRTPLVFPFDEAAARARLDRARRLRAEGTTILLVIATDGGAALGEVMLRRAPEGEGIVHCPSCARPSGIDRWSWEDDYHACGHLGFTFWGWAELTSDFTREIGRKLGGHRTVLLAGKL